MKHVSIITIALGISSCTVTETTAPDGTVTKTTTISGEGISAGAAGAAMALNAVSGDK